MIDLKAVSKSFKSGEKEFFALKDISLSIPSNKVTIISGPSGSGKSTLLSVIGLLQTPSQGDLLINSEKIDFKNTSYLRNYINKNICYVFQEFNLIDDFSVADNILIVCNDIKTVDDILSSIGLIDKKQTPTKLLSGGEKQRLAIGRAIAKGGDIILLDEPTGNLDEENSRLIFDLLKRLSTSKTIIVVTHNMSLASSYADYVILLNSGHTVSQFSLNQNKYDIDLNENSIDVLRPLCEILVYKIKSSGLSIQVTDEKKEKNYFITSGTLLSVVSQVYNDYKGKPIKITLKPVVDENQSNSSIISINSSNKIFSFKHIWKYSLIMFNSKLWRNIFSILLLVLNAVMIFVYTNFMTYDYVGATKNGINENNAYFTQPYISEINDVTSQVNRYFSGINLFDTLEEMGVSPFPMLRVSSDISFLQLSLIVINEPIRYRSTLVELPPIDKVVVSSFISEIAETDTISISNYGVEDCVFNYALTIEKAVDCALDQQDLDNFLNDSNYQNVNKDRFVNDYSVAFISKDTFTKIKQSAQYRLSASNFLISGQSMRTYAERQVYYDVFSSNNLIAGRTPSDEYDVVISSSFFNQYDALSDFESLEDCLEQEVNYKDLNESPNRDLYQTTLNFYDITPKVKIVGVTDDTTAQVYVSSSFMNSIITKKDYYLSGYFIDLVSNSNLLKSMLDSDIYFDLSYLVPILTMKNLMNSDFGYVVLGAMLIILISTITFLSLTFIANVKGKYKEIAILKSFGTRKINITGLFLLLNYFIALVSILCGLPLALGTLNLINAAFMSPSVFAINYLLIVPTPVSFAIVIFIPLIAALISTILSLRKVNSIDIALALKMY